MTRIHWILLAVVVVAVVVAIALWVFPAVVYVELLRALSGGR